MIPARARDELRRLLPLAIPSVLSSLGTMAMFVVDTAMVGRLGSTPLAATAVASAAFDVVFMFTVGTLEGATPAIAQAVGSGDQEGARAWFRQGVWVAVAAGLGLMAYAQGMDRVLEALGQEPALARMGGEYVRAHCLGAVFATLFILQRAYLHGLGHTRPVMWIVFAANALNVVLNYALIFGELGAPRLGIVGAGLSTAGCSLFQALAGALWIRRLAPAPPEGRRGPDLARVRRLLALGVPIGCHLLLEVGLFASITLLAGWLGSVAVAGHQIALRLVSFFFMLPLGLGAAASVRVGHELGRGDADAAAHAGRVALGTTCGLMLALAALFTGLPHLLVAPFTTDPALAAQAILLLRIAAVWELSDGLQVVASHCLRGTGDTRGPLLVNLLAHWGVGVPLAWTLAFPLGMGVAGLWWGLAASLTVAAVLLCRLFLREGWRTLPRIRAD